MNSLPARSRCMTVRLALLVLLVALPPLGAGSGSFPFAPLYGQEPPVAEPVSITVAYGSGATNVPLSLSGGEATSVAIDTAPSYGTAIASGTSITYQPNATFAGPDSFAYTASNSGGTSAPATVTVTVNDPSISITPSGTFTATGGSPYSQTFTFNGGAPPWSDFQIFNLPAGLSITGTTANSVTVSGTPTQAGGFHLSVSATDTSTGNGPYTVGQMFALTVLPGPASISVSPATVAEDGVTNLVYTITLAATQSVAITVNLSASGTATEGSDYPVVGTTIVVPVHATVATLVVNPTADADVESDETVILTIQSGSGYTVGSPSSATGTILNDDAVPPVAGPVAITVPYGSGATDVPLSLSGGEATSVAIHTAPSYGTAIASGTSITYQPNATFAGADSFTYTATNMGGTSAPATVTVTVNDPIITITPSGTFTATGGSPWSQTFTFNGGAPPWSGYQVTNLPAGLSITGTTANSVTVSGTPTQAGGFNLNVSATDISTGNGPYTVGQAFTLTVLPGPVSIAVSPASVAEDGPANLVYTITCAASQPVAINVNLSASGTATAGSDYPAIGTSIVVPAHATVATLVVDPTADADVESDETVIFSIQSGSGYTVGTPSSATGTILNDDDAANQPPVLAAIGSRSVQWGSLLTFTASANDPDLANTLSFSLDAATIALGASIDPSSGVFAWTPDATQMGSRTVTISVADNGVPSESDSETFVIEVGKRETTLAYTGALSGTCAEQVTLAATLTDVETGEPLSGRTISFEIAGHRESEPTGTNGSASIQQVVGHEAGPYVLDASFGGDALYEPASTTVTFTSSGSRSVVVESIGEPYVATSCVTCTSAAVTLVALITDPLETGNVTGATVDFIDVDTTEVLCENAPVGLIDESAPWSGVAVCGATLSEGSYSIAMVAGECYEGSVITPIEVAKPEPYSVSGGGYLVLSDSAGLFAGDDGTRNGFGFTVKYRKGNAPQGRANVIVRRGALTYQIKATAITSLTVKNGRATLQAKATIQDITNPLLPVPIDGNAKLQISMTDNGEPGTDDTIGITVLNKKGGVWFSSNWTGSRTAEQQLDGGNLQIR
jgi:hypothetical protein